MVKVKRRTARSTSVENSSRSFINGSSRTKSLVNWSAYIHFQLTRKKIFNPAIWKVNKLMRILNLRKQNCILGMMKTLTLIRFARTRRHPVRPINPLSTHLDDLENWSPISLRISSSRLRAEPFLNTFYGRNHEHITVAARRIGQ